MESFSEVDEEVEVEVKKKGGRKAKPKVEKPPKPPKPPKVVKTKPEPLKMTVFHGECIVYFED